MSWRRFLNPNEAKGVSLYAEQTAPSFLSTRRGLRLTFPALLAMAVAIALLLLGPTRSDAAVVEYVPAGNFSAADANGVIPGGIDVDQNTGDVYVANPLASDFASKGEIKVFDGDGTADTPIAQGVAQIVGLAFDENDDELSAVCSDGLVGSCPGESNEIYTFETDGTTAAGPFDVSGEPFQWPFMDADAAGNIYYPNNVTDAVEIYDTSGALQGSITGTGANELVDPRAVAIDSSGNAYIADADGSGRVQKFDSNGDFLSELASGTTYPSVAVDKTDDTVFVGRGLAGATFRVDVYDAAGVQFDSFGEGDFGSVLSPPNMTPDIAVNESTGRVYVSDPRGGDFGPSGLVHMYDKEVTLEPAVTTDPVSSLGGTSATLNATVNAEGSDADCVFQYTTDADFQANGFDNATEVACDPDPVTGDTDTQVSAEITGLTTETDYQYRAQATNAGGTTNGDATAFTTPVDPPTLSTEPVTSVGQTTATLNATVDANSDDADCMFQYVDEASFDVDGFAGAQTEPCSVDPVTGDVDTEVFVNIVGLTPNTGYVYRVSATNDGGTTNGNSVEFMTLALEPTVITGSTTGVNDTSATLNGVVNANGAASDCTFQYTSADDHAANGFANATSADCSIDPVSGETNTAVSATITGLAPKTAYVFRGSATNNGGTSNGSAEAFTTTNQAAYQACVDDAQGAFDAAQQDATRLDKKAAKQGKKAKKLKKKAKKLKKKAKKASSKKAKKLKKKAKKQNKKTKKSKKKSKKLSKQADRARTDAQSSLDAALAQCEELR